MTTRARKQNKMSEPFRTAQPATEAKDQKTVKGVSDSSSPINTHAPELFATHEEDIGKPYTAEYFEITNVWDKDESLKRDVKEIEGYVRDQVRKGKVDNSTKAANQFLKELERKAGLSRYESSNTRIDKLLAYIDFQQVVNGDKKELERN